jgi:predicted RecA/RadA family phage recombinase
MSLCQFVAEGFSIDYIPLVALAAGDVVDLGNFIGIATTDTAIGAPGSLQVEGKYWMPKASAEVIALGTRVYWDVDTKLATATAAGAEATAGACIRDAAAGETRVLVKLVIVLP